MGDETKQFTVQAVSSSQTMCLADAMYKLCHATFHDDCLSCAHRERDEWKAANERLAAFVSGVADERNGLQLEVRQLEEKLLSAEQENLELRKA